jgi:hypothetical protein
MKIHAALTHLIVLAGILILSATISPAQSPHPEMDKSISDNIGDPTKFQIVLANLKKAVEKHDAAATAQLVSYPITINPRTKTAMSIRTPLAFIELYDKIITPYIADVIEKQKYEKLFVNYQGAMLGSGEIWIAGICKDKTCKQVDIKVRTIQNTAGKSK